MPSRFSSKPIPFTNWQLLLRRAFRYLPWKKRNDGSVMEHAAPIIDLFASIVMRDERMSETDADSALDFLRYSFPEAEHSWLARHFKKATESIHPVSQLAVIAGTNRSLQERMSMAMEVLSLLKNARDQRAIDTLFEEVTMGLMLPGASPLLKAMLDDPTAPPPEPVLSLRFNISPEADVTLSKENDDIQFRVFLCGELMLVINDGQRPLRVRGRSLPPQSLIPLSSGQIINLKTAPLTYSGLMFFFNAKKTGTKLTFYVTPEDGSLVVQRARGRTSQLRLTFGLNAEVELLKKADVRLDGTPLEMGKPVQVTYSSALMLGELGPFTLSQLQSRTEDIGRRFHVDPGRKTVRVSNDPSRIGAGDLLLTQGLSANVLLEVTFSRSEKSGLLLPLEFSESLTINGKIVKGPTPLNDGDLIRISYNQSLRCRFESGVLDEERNVLHELQVEGLCHSYAGGVRVLDNIDFSVQRGEMLCILGPSGSGKSTLLSCLAGHLAPERGAIRYNGLRLYTWQNRLAPLIAHIPREDVLNPYQTVQEHLTQALTIRRPRLTSSDRKRRTYSLLKYLGLTHLASRRVGASTDKHLSDGERTRLNLGLDMSGISDVFLIDEPISGLSSRDSENVIETLENISREKIVIATLHRPSAHLLNRFHKVILLDHGGQMAYWGTPRDMFDYFKEAARDMGVAVSTDNESAGGADYVFEVLEAPLLWHDPEDQHPRLWQERYENYRFRYGLNGSYPTDMGAMTRSDMTGTIPERPRRKLTEYWRLFRVWFIRTIAARIRSRTNLYTALLEGPILAFLIAFPLRFMKGGEGYLFSGALHISSYIFLSTIVAMFFGLMAGATEVIRDKPLLKRERNSRIFYSGYMGAKTIVLLLITGVQCALYLLVGNALLSLHELFWPFLFTLLITSFIGLSVSLLVSLLLKTERAALNMVPLLLVPQILLAGAVVPFDEMNAFIVMEPRHEAVSGALKPGRVPYVSELCPLRYSYEALLVLQAKDNAYEYNRRLIQKRVDQLKMLPGNLTREENRHLKLLLQALTSIASLESTNAKEAEYGLRRIREAALRNDAEYYLKFLDTFQTRGEGVKKYSLSHFFVNERLSGQFELAEALRFNREMEERPEIFLSLRKPVPFTRNDTDREDPTYTADKKTISTPLYNNLHLLLMGLLALLASRYVLKRKLEQN